MLRRQSSRSKLIQANVLWWWLFADLPYLSATFYGNFRQCYNFDEVHATTTGSFKIVGVSPVCRVFREADCTGGFMDVKKADGVAIYDGSSPSFICEPPAGA